MIHVEIRPVLRFRAGEEREFDFRMVPLLEGIESTGKLTRAAAHAGMSYRHAWNLIEQWTAFFGAPLVVMVKGRGTRLTPLGAKLLWAGKRTQARLEPELANLASDLGRALNDALHKTIDNLVLHASHDFAVATLPGLGAKAGVALHVQYQGSFDALATLRRGECDIAGFHVPDGPMGVLMAKRYVEGLSQESDVVISFVQRTQGLIVRAGNPKRIQSVADLTRDDVRMVNRLRGSGTRALLEYQLTAAGIDRTRIRGYGNEEATHSAVATQVASEVADVGLGVAEAAVQYRLDFVPSCTERYYFACTREALATPAVASFVALLRSPEVAKAARALAGYRSERTGEVMEVAGLLRDHVALAAAG